MSAPVAAAGSNASPAETTAPHPRGLYVLFATEMWERFSYYGMRALLVLYLVNGLGWAPKDSSNVYKWYTSLVYLTPLLGGFLADRYLGLRSSIVAGGVLMAIGHFLMAFERLPFFFAALAFLIAGNGFFKPNISTLVGKMYGPDDRRRDGAFTIFYMGINIGAGLSPIVCGWLRQKYGYGYGFGAAGVGMVIGLTVFLLGQTRVMADVKAAGNDIRTARERARDKAADKASDKPDDAAAAQADDATPGAGGVAGLVSKGFPIVLIVAALGMWAQYGYLFAKGEISVAKLIMPLAFGGIAVWMGYTLSTIKGASKDRSVVIFALFIFAVLFWMAFEQAGNALNLFAEFYTRLSIGTFEYPAEWFQSVNAVFIVMLAPVFSAMWIFLARKKLEISTPAKMLAAMILMALSFVAMVGGAAAENATVSRVPLRELPAGFDPSKVAAGRLAYDAAAHELTVRGVLPPFAVSEALTPTVPPDYSKSLGKLDDGSQNASAQHPVTQVLEGRPPGFTLAFDAAEGDAPVWDAAAGTVTVKRSLTATEKTTLLAAAAPPEYRAALAELAKASNAARVSSFWLILSYLLATLAELCLSPVGLSMVTKLAPARFASLFMGIWLLASSVAQYVGGSLGELWGTVTPTSYFMIFVYTSIGGAALLVLLVSPLKKLMHGVN